MEEQHSVIGKPIYRNMKPTGNLKIISVSIYGNVKLVRKYDARYLLKLPSRTVTLSGCKLV